MEIPYLVYKYSNYLDPKVCKIMAQNHYKQPKRPLFYLFFGSRKVGNSYSAALAVGCWTTMGIR